MLSGLRRARLATSAIGVRDLPARMVRGFDGEAMVVSDEAASVEVDGGAAAAAGRAAAVARVKAEVALTPQPRSSTRPRWQPVKPPARPSPTRRSGEEGRRDRAGQEGEGWLKALKDEVVDAMGPPDEDCSGGSGPATPPIRCDCRGPQGRRAVYWTTL